jgi:hypothetical protein
MEKGRERRGSKRRRGATAGVSARSKAEMMTKTARCEMRLLRCKPDCTEWRPRQQEMLMLAETGSSLW